MFMLLNNVMNIEHALRYIFGIHVGLRNELKSIALLEFFTTRIR